MTAPVADASRRTFARRAAAACLIAVAATAAVLGVSAAGCRKPVPPAPAPPAVLVPPLHDAALGEELRLRRGSDEDWVWRISSATDDYVEAEYSVYRAGIVDSSAACRVRWTRNGFGIPDGYVIREISRDRIDIDGRSWECWRLRCHSRTDVRWYWISDQVPGGIL